MTGFLQYWHTYQLNKMGFVMPNPSPALVNPAPIPVDERYTTLSQRQKKAMGCGAKYGSKLMTVPEGPVCCRPCRRPFKSRYALKIHRSQLHKDD